MGARIAAINLFQVDFDKPENSRLLCYEITSHLLPRFQKSRGQ